MGDGMNTAQLARFDSFFNRHYWQIPRAVTEGDPSGALRRTRSGFASAYRFWSKVEADGDPAAWIRRAIAEDRHAATRDRSSAQRANVPRPHPSIDLDAEHRRVVSLARHQRFVARVVIGTSAFFAVAGELFVANR